MPLTNTLETARRLESLGFSHQQAQGVAELFEVTAQDARRDLATRGDLELVRREIAELRTEIKAELDGLRTEINAEIGGLRTIVNAEIGGLRTEIKSDLVGLRAEFRDELRKQMLWFFTVLTALLGIAVAVI